VLWLANGISNLFALLGGDDFDDLKPIKEIISNNVGTSGQASC